MPSTIEHLPNKQLVNILIIIFRHLKLVYKCKTYFCLWESSIPSCC